MPGICFESGGIESILNTTRSMKLLFLPAQAFLHHIYTLRRVVLIAIGKAIEIQESPHV